MMAPMAQDRVPGEENAVPSFCVDAQRDRTGADLDPVQVVQWPDGAPLPTGGARGAESGAPGSAADFLAQRPGLLPAFLDQNLLTVAGEEAHEGVTAPTLWTVVNNGVAECGSPGTSEMIAAVPRESNAFCSLPPCVMTSKLTSVFDPPVPVRLSGAGSRADNDHGPEDALDVMLKLLLPQ